MKEHTANHNLSDGDYKAHLKKAIDAAETMINVDKKHELYPDFGALFTYDGEGRQNKENVFVRVYGPNDSPVNTNNQTHSNSRQLENTTTLTRNIVDLFLYMDGLPREKSSLVVTPETCFNDVFINRDPRLAFTVYQKDEESYKGAYVPFSFRYGYNIKKGFILKDWSNLNAEVKLLTKWLFAMLKSSYHTQKLFLKIMEVLPIINLTLL